MSKAALKLVRAKRRLAVLLALAACLAGATALMGLAGCKAKPAESWYRPAAADLPAEVATWLENSLPLDAGQSLGAGSTTYALITWGNQPQGAAVEIVDVAPLQGGTPDVEVTVRYTRAPAAAAETQPPNRPRDLVAIRLSGAKVTWKVEGNPDARVFQVLNGAVEPIVAESKWIKLYGPEPGSIMNSGFLLRGLSNVFEGTINYRLVVDYGMPSQTVVDQGFATGAMGDWGLFETVLTFPHEAAYMPAVLQVFWVSPADGADCDLFEVPLTLGASGPG